MIENILGLLGVTAYSKGRLNPVTSRYVAGSARGVIFFVFSLFFCYTFV
jgi:hypothetical protein